MPMHQFHHWTEKAERYAETSQRKFGIEPAGTPLQQNTQKLIHREHCKLRELDGAVSFGRSVGAFVPDIGVAETRRLIVDFRRLLLLGNTNEVGTVADTTRSAGADVSGHMPIIGAVSNTFFLPALATLSRFNVSTGGHLSILAEDASHSSVRELQDLQIAVGLTPLPGAFLRSSHGRIATVCYHDYEGRLLASASLADLEGAGPEFADTAILLGVSVHPDARGNGFGSAITAAGLVQARRLLAAHRVIAVVSPTNTAALHTNAKFGMYPLADQSAIYLELCDAD